MASPQLITAPLPGSVDPLPPSLLSASYDHLDPTKSQPGFITTHLVDKEGKKWDYQVFERPIVKSGNDDRDYRLIRLTNGLEVMLVHDPKTDKAAASLSVRVGSMSDPDELPGLAHFCEHLLFMGTEKFPVENEYSDYLARNNGSSNAFTSLTQTCYYFSVSPLSSAFHGALSRFSQFFISPLFSPSCTEREVKAVDSEHQKNLQDDAWRIEMVKQGESNRTGEGRKFWHFGTGSRETLWEAPKKRNPELEDGGIRAELLKFHERWYSANLFKCAILGKDSLDTMTEWAVTLFSDARNNNVPPPLFAPDPYTDKELGKRTVIQTLRERRNLEILFPFPPQDQVFASKPSQIISHFIGHEGPGSILSHLKRRGWADSLYAGSSSESYDFDFFTINVSLTSLGLTNYESVASSIFAYISLLRSRPTPQWAFDEQRALARTSFRFSQKGSPMRYVSWLSGQMHEPYSREGLLWAGSMLEVWDEEAVRQGLERLHVAKARLTICAKREEVEALGVAEWAKERREEWYGTRYWTADLSDKLRELQDGKPDGKEFEDLYLPERNPFVPEDLEVRGKVDVAEPSRRPLYISESPITSIWHKKDDRWWIPKASVNFLLANPLWCSTIERDVTTQLFTTLFEDALNERSYDAQLAELSWSVGLLTSGVPSLALGISGYNDKLPVLLEVVLKEMKEFKVDRTRFEEIKDQHRRSLKNRIEFAKPVNMGYNAVDYVLAETDTLPEQELPILEAVTPEDVEKQIREGLKDLKITTLVMGNVVKQDALSIGALPEKIFGSKAVPADAVKRSKARLLPDSSNYVYTKIVPDAENRNSAIRYAVHLGSNDDQRLRCISSLFAQCAEEPAFNQLRTVEQLGYLVWSHLSVNEDQRFYGIAIQSERDPIHLEERVEAFFDTLKGKIEGMTEEEFGEIRTSVVERKKEDYKNMPEESRSYWSTIASGLIYDFDAPRQDAQIIEKITKSEVLDFFLKNIHPSASARRKISAHIRSQRLTESELSQIEAQLTESLGPIAQDKAEAFKVWKDKRPTADEVQKDIWQFVAASDATSEAKAKVEKVIEDLRPQPPKQLKAGVTIIEDLDQFAQSLKVAGEIKPVVEYKDFVSSL